MCKLLEAFLINILKIDSFDPNDPDDEKIDYDNNLSYNLVFDVFS